MGKPCKRSRPIKRANHCGTKNSFDTQEQADAAAYRPRRMLSRVGFMQAYKCRFCRQWHYGHPQGFK